MRYAIGQWQIDVPCDIEYYKPFRTGDGEMIPHSEYGARFRREATIAEKCQLIDQITGGGTHDETTIEEMAEGAAAE